MTNNLYSGDDGVTLTAESPEETRAVAARVAALLRAGDVLCLYGDLGAGKTTFVQGLAAALESRASVTSPTFTLVHEYRDGRLPLFHFDVYRLSGPSALADLGFDEYLAAGGVVVIEWADRIAAALPKERLDIMLEEEEAGAAGDEAAVRRRVTLDGREARWFGLRAAWEREVC